MAYGPASRMSGPLRIRGVGERRSPDGGNREDPWPEYGGGELVGAYIGQNGGVQWVGAKPNGEELWARKTEKGKERGVTKRQWRTGATPSSLGQMVVQGGATSQIG
ncbi:hypothetical protein NL676_034205 [Syzygium grande]|nr:hypothetical protein NL676_034205 [Syzygium grande]